MNILDIYRQYRIPPNLVRHQIEVTAVGRFICDHWTGDPVDRDLLTQTLLLHDMGNIIKFKRPFLGELEKAASHWEQVQEEFIQKYGKDVHAATLQIIQDLGLPNVAILIDQMRNIWAKADENSTVEARIAEYSDCCVTPDGIVGFQRRIEDLKIRYHGYHHSQELERMYDNARYLQRFVTVDLATLAENDFSREIVELQRFQIVSSLK